MMIETKGYHDVAKDYLALEREHPSIKLATSDSYIVLATPCRRCRATGGHCQYQNEGPWLRCTLCGGRGYLMTPEGKELARFVQVFGVTS